MAKLFFDRKHALEAIRLARAKGQNWLYESYPKPNGRVRRSITGFLMYEGMAYPVKPLGRLAGEIAGDAIAGNPTTDVFRGHFEKLGFQLIDSPEDEAESAIERQRHLAETWVRKDQAKFRRAVFELYGARCLITGCETLVALEAAHVLPVSGGGCDEGWNGIPLRADVHRLFDADVIALDPNSWTLSVKELARKEYGQYEGKNLEFVFADIAAAPKLAEALRRRRSLATQI